MAISIYTDASSRADLNKTVYGLILLDEDDIILMKKTNTTKFKECNSSRGELLAVVMAYELCDIVDDVEIEVITDSDYVYNASLTDTLKNKKSKLRKNLEDIEKLIALRERFGDRVKLTLVKGHSNTHFNNCIDKIVRALARDE